MQMSVHDHENNRVCLQELCEQLRDISYQRREEDEKERDVLLGEGWLEDHTAILINHHSILLQVTFLIWLNKNPVLYFTISSELVSFGQMEMDRFQATLCILKVYYLSMHSQMFSDFTSNAFRVSLLDTQTLKDQYKG